jgi:hypothetical protein
VFQKGRFGLRRQAERDAALGWRGSGKALSPLRSASAVQKLLPKFGEKLVFEHTLTL